MGIYTNLKQVSVGIEWGDLSIEAQFGIANEFGMTRQQLVEFYNLDDAGVFIGKIDGYKEEKISLNEFIDKWFNEAREDDSETIYRFSEEDLIQFKSDLKEFLEVDK